MKFKKEDRTKFALAFALLIFSLFTILHSKGISAIYQYDTPDIYSVLDGINYTQEVNGSYVPYIGAITNVNLNNKNLSTGRLLVGNGSAFTGNDLANVYTTNITTKDSYTTAMFGTLEYIMRIGGVFNDNTNYMWDPSGVGLLISTKVNDGKDYYFMDGLYVEKITKNGGTINSIAGVYVSDQDQGTYNYGIVTNKGYVYHGDKVKIKPDALFFDETDIPVEALDVVGNGTFTGHINTSYDSTFGDANSYLKIEKLDLGGGNEFPMVAGYSTSSLGNLSALKDNLYLVGITDDTPSITMFDSSLNSIGLVSDPAQGQMTIEDGTADGTIRSTLNLKRGGLFTPSSVGDGEQIVFQNKRGTGLFSSVKTDIASVGGIITATALNNYAGDMFFKTQNNGSFTEKMRIKNNGDVGIGTDTPSQKLHVQGNVYSSGSYYGDGSQLTGISTYNSTYNTWAYNQTIGLNNTYVPYTGSIQNFNSTKSISTTGTVVFGKTTPETQYFNVYSSGGGSLRGVTITHESNNGGAPQLIFRKAHGATGTISSLVQSGDVLGTFYSYPWNGTQYGAMITAGMAMTVNQTGQETVINSTYIPADITFNTYPYPSTTLQGQKMIITNGGRVGIMTNTPTQTLDVNGSANIGSNGGTDKLGINNPSPLFNLHVGSSSKPSNTYIQTESDSAYVAGISWAEAGNRLWFLNKVQNDINDSLYIINNQSVAIVTFTQDGRVGIGYPNKTDSSTMGSSTLNVNGTINAVSNYSINGVNGITQGVTIMKTAVTTCDLNFTGGILTATTC